MKERDLAEIIEKIGELLSDFIHDSEEIKSLIEQIKEMGSLPAIAVEARLTLFEEIDEEVEIIEEAQLLLSPLDFEKEFEESITSEDINFLKSIIVIIRSIWRYWDDGFKSFYPCSCCCHRKCTVV